jgi:hypothetical protein
MGSTDLNDYKTQLQEFLGDRLNRKYSAYLLRKLLANRLRKGKYVIVGQTFRKEFLPEDLEQKTFEVCDALVKACLEKGGYDASVIPTVISQEQAPNFRIKETMPKEDELWKFLHLILTGLHSRELVVNLDGVSPDLSREFRNRLIREEYLVCRKQFVGLDTGKILHEMKAPAVPVEGYPFIFSFLILAYFAKFWQDIKKESNKIAGLPKEWLISEYPPLKDDATLVVFTLHRGENQMYAFSRLHSLMSRWFTEFHDGIPVIVRFVFSLYIADRKYRDESVATLNKFLYYLLRGEVNGELLNRLVVDKVSFELQNQKVYGIASTSEFLKALTSSLRPSNE